MQACYYEADPDDPIDKQLSWHFMSLDREFASSLVVRRLGNGEYEFDGRRLRLRWAGEGDETKPELVVLEDTPSDTGAIETTLAAYLRQAQDVAALLGGRKPGCPALQRVPADRRLTFAHVPRQMSDDPAVERLRSMRVACEQARLREHAAEAYERAERGRSGNPLHSLVPSLSLPAVPGDAGTRAPTPPPQTVHGVPPTGGSSVRSATPPPRLPVPLGAPGTPLAAPMAAPWGGLAPSGCPRLPSKGRMSTPPPRTFERSPTPPPPDRPLATFVPVPGAFSPHPLPVVMWTPGRS